nr:hypothetical protein [Allomuricauda sp.]
MRLFKFTLLITPYLLLGCKDSDLSNELLETQKKLVQTEQVLLKTLDKNNANNNLIRFYEETAHNLILSKNDTYTIRIDETQKGDLRYSSWAHPKTTNQNPDVVLYEGTKEKSGNWGVFKYEFNQDTHTYIVETVPVGRTSKENHIFLEIRNRNSQQFYSKMDDLRKPRQF